MTCFKLLAPQNSPLMYIFIVYKSMDEETETNKGQVNSVR